MVERGIDTTNTRIHARSIFLLGKDTSIKCGGVKLVLWTQLSSLSEMMQSNGLKYINMIKVHSYAV